MLDIPLAAIYEVITFYNYFKLVPPGKHTISICMGTACYLKGALLLLEEARSLLGIMKVRQPRTPFPSAGGPLSRLLRIVACYHGR
jgi:NADH:ubiquinone oxidoreductase subunit E